MAQAISRNRRIVQGTGLFYLVFGIIAIVTAALMFFGAPLAADVMEDGVQIAEMFGIILACIGVFMIVAGVIGLRAAKHDGLLKPFIYISAFIVVLNLSEIGLTFTSGEGGSIYMNLIYAVFSFVAIVAASRALNEAQEGSAR